MKFRKCMVVLILLGVLLTGIGTGIGFAEYSTLDYQGNVILGEDSMQEERFVWELGEKTYKRLQAYCWGVQEEAEVVQDKTVPQDEVWFDVTYNESYGKPEMGHMEVYEDSEKPAGKIAATDLYIHSADVEKRVRTFIEGRDRMLEDLKEKKFSTYEFAGIYKIKVYVSPDNYEKFEMM